jgi:hypothetical protein
MQLPVATDREMAEALQAYLNPHRLGKGQASPTVHVPTGLWKPDGIPNSVFSDEPGT